MDIDLMVYYDGVWMLLSEYRSIIINKYRSLK